MRRDVVALSVLIGAMALLIFNGSQLFQEVMQGAKAGLRPEIKVAVVALTLNLALILFGWRRYVDLLHESERRLEGEARAAHMAVTDAITGLANRKGFIERGEELRQAAAKDIWLAVISLRLHRFKAINDRHGYEIGDDLLRAVASAISASAGSACVAARLNGDEFALVLAIPEKDKAIAARAGEALLHSVSRPFLVYENLLQVGCHVGIAAAPAAGVAVQDLLRRADIALSHACEQRAAAPVWFDQGMERALIARAEIEEGIRSGLEQEQFLPFFEPQVDLESGTVVGFEVLARWNRPGSEPISPDAFIPVAEEAGLIGYLSDQIMRLAFKEAASWDQAVKLSVNISPAQLADPWLAQKIVRSLTETGFPAERLIVEITESSLFADLELARSIAASLKNQGIKLALDDFGTGYSSLASLRSLPFDVIKIDRGFTATIHRDPQSAAIVRAVTTLANALNVPVTIEGVEDATTHAAVRGFGCAFAQGWHFGKPMSAREARALLSRSEPAAATRAAAR